MTFNSNLSIFKERLHVKMQITIIPNFDNYILFGNGGATQSKIP